MSSSFITALPDLVIADGATDSNVLIARLTYEDALAIVLHGRSVPDAGPTYTIQVSHDPEAGTPAWETLRQGDPAALLSAAPPNNGFARGYIELPWFAGFRIHADGAVTGIQTWKASKAWKGALIQ
jgi:hypothetical protein